MTDLAIERTTTSRVEDRSWLAPGAHGVDMNKTVTLDTSKFTEGTHFPDGWILAGTVLGIVTASSLYGPYDNTATDGRQVARGHLYDSAKVAAGSTRIVAPMYRHGAVIEANLPTNHGLDSAAKTDLAALTYE